jgi:uncharacterized protein (DUF362 family)
MSRRDFLRRAAGAGALVLGAGVLGGILYDPHGPPAAVSARVLDGLGDFSVKTPGKAMAMVRGGQDREGVRAAMLDQALAALGGIERFIQRGDRVLIKVNAAFSTPAALGATTHPDLLAAVADRCLGAGASRVAVTDNPINNPMSCFETSGLAEAARSVGARLVLPKADLFVPASLPGGRLIRDWPVMAGALQGMNKLIAVTPVKDHHRAGASMVLKNFYGLLGGRRNVFHQDINGIIAELALLVRPTLCILDGTVSMMTNGPTGGSLSDLKHTGTLIVSTDPVAADGAGIELLGRTLSDIPYILAAQAAGAGTADWKSLDPAVLTLSA